MIDDLHTWIYLRSWQSFKIKNCYLKYDLITIYKLMNNLEKTDRKHLIVLRRKGMLEIWEDPRKNCKKEFVWMIQKNCFPQRSIDTWT